MLQLELIFTFVPPDKFCPFLLLGIIILNKYFIDLRKLNYFHIFFKIQNASAFFKPDSEPLFIAKASIDSIDLGCG